VIALLGVQVETNGAGEWRNAGMAKFQPTVARGSARTFWMATREHPSAAAAFRTERSATSGGRRRRVVWAPPERLPVGAGAIVAQHRALPQPLPLKFGHARDHPEDEATGQPGEWEPPAKSKPARDPQASGAAGICAARLCIAAASKLRSVNRVSE
jgi:hypothetical protein